MSDAFTPARAQSAGGLIVGRQGEVARIVTALLEEQTHVVLFSERGRGKTSLTNLATDALRERGATVARYSCEADDAFDAVIRGVFRNLPAALLPLSRRRAKGDGCEALLPKRSLRAGDVVEAARAFAGRPTILVVDEFDRTKDLATRTRIADTMKLLSDSGAALRFVLVAVSATVEEILGEHPSVQRNLFALHLPLLSDADIRTMLSRGGAQAEVSFSETAMTLVTQVARGMPYVAQLLGLRIVQSVLRRDGKATDNADLAGAVRQLAAETPAAVKAIYAALLAVPHEDMAEVLRHVAGADQDRLGAMRLEEQGQDVVLGGVPLSRNAFSLLLASGVLAQSLGEPGAAHVKDRGVMVHVLLLAALAWLESAREDIAAA